MCLRATTNRRRPHHHATAPSRRTRWNSCGQLKARNGTRDQQTFVRRLSLLPSSSKSSPSMRTSPSMRSPDGLRDRARVGVAQGEAREGRDRLDVHALAHDVEARVADVAVHRRRDDRLQRERPAPVARAVDPQRAVGPEHLAAGGAVDEPDGAVPLDPVRVLVVLADAGAAVLVVQVAGHDDVSAAQPQGRGSSRRGQEQHEGQGGPEGPHARGDLPEISRRRGLRRATAASARSGCRSA